MRKNFGAKPWTYPQPVFILAAYGEDGTPDAMNAAWGGISEDKELSMCISAEHKTTANILARKAFTVSMATVDQLVACDYVGIESGNRVPEKVSKAGWHTTPSEFVDAPLIDELPMAVECRLVSYDPESCRLVARSSTSAPTNRSWTPTEKLTRTSSSPLFSIPSTTPIANWAKRPATPSGTGQS